MEREKICEQRGILEDARGELTPMAYDNKDLNLARSHVFEAIDSLKFLEQDPSDSYYHSKSIRQCGLAQKHLGKYLANEENPDDSNYSKVEDIEETVKSVIEELGEGKEYGICK